MNKVHNKPTPPLPDTANHYHVDIRSNRVFQLHQYSGQPDFYYHYHDEYELVFIRGTRGKRLVAGNILSYGPKDVILLGPHIPHTYIFEELDIETEDLLPKNIVFHFTLRSLGIDFLDKEESTAIKKLISNAEMGLCFTNDIYNEVESKLKGIERNEPFQQLIQFYSVLDILSRCTSPTPLTRLNINMSRNNKDHKVFAGAIQYIKNNLHHTISLNEISKKLNMSTANFSRFYRRHSGSSFISYINQWRIENAKLMLQENQNSILDISYSVGYKSPSHFNRQFNKISGMSPREYRHWCKNASNL
jgi:AraC-like DNA-binding protein